MTVASHLARPTRTAGAETPAPLSRSARPLFGLAPGGVCPATCVTAGAVRSYRTISPLPALRRVVYFLWHFPSDRSGRVLPAAVFRGVRTFLPPPRLHALASDHPAI